MFIGIKPAQSKNAFSLLIQPPKNQQVQDTANTAASLLDFDVNPTEAREFPLVRLNTIQMRHFEFTYVMEHYFTAHMAERDLLFQDAVADTLRVSAPREPAKRVAPIKKPKNRRISHVLPEH